MSYDSYLCLLDPILFFCGFLLLLLVVWSFFIVIFIFNENTYCVSSSFSWKPSIDSVQACNFSPFQPNMLRTPAQLWCLLHLNPVTMKSVPLPMWRTAALMFVPAPMARIVCALLLLITQQPVLGRMSWSSGGNLTSAVSEMLLNPTYFPGLKGIS